MQRQFLSILFALVISGVASARSKDVELLVRPVAQGISVLLINNGDNSIVVDKRFAVNPVHGELDFRITNETGIHSLAVIQNVDKPGKDDFILLQPRDFVGHVMSLDMIAATYNLTRGCYRVQATYHYKLADNESTYRGPVRSNVIVVCVSNANVRWNEAKQERN